MGAEDRDDGRARECTSPPRDSPSRVHPPTGTPRAVLERSHLDDQLRRNPRLWRARSRSALTPTWTAIPLRTAARGTSGARPSYLARSSYPCRHSRHRPARRVLPGSTEHAPALAVPRVGHLEAASGARRPRRHAVERRISRQSPRPEHRQARHVKHPALGRGPLKRRPTVVFQLVGKPLLPDEPRRRGFGHLGSRDCTDADWLDRRFPQGVTLPRPAASDDGSLMTLSLSRRRTKRNRPGDVAIAPAPDIGAIASSHACDRRPERKPTMPIA